MFHGLHALGGGWGGVGRGCAAEPVYPALRCVFLSACVCECECERGVGLGTAGKQSSGFYTTANLIPERRPTKENDLIQFYMHVRDNSELGV